MKMIKLNLSPSCKKINIKIRTTIPKHCVVNFKIVKTTNAFDDNH